MRWQLREPCETPDQFFPGQIWDLEVDSDSVAWIMFKDDQWWIETGSHGWDFTVYPDITTLEEAQATALALWRMS